jgi:hypothetical protein
MHRASLCLSLFLMLTSFTAFADDDIPLVNWPVPGASSATTRKFHPKATADIGGPVVFVPMTPCRVINTLNPNGPYGGPIFNAGETRSYSVTSSSCTGIPSSLVALSLNFSVTQTQAGGFLTAWAYGTSQPGVANLTWFAAGQTLTSASIVPTDSSGAISVYVGMPNGTQTHVIVDINGYFLGDGGNGGDTLNINEHLALTGTFNGGVIRGKNLSTNPSLATSGVRGIVVGGADNISGVNGESSGGLNFGVSGINDAGAFGAAGVLGVMHSRPFVNFGTDDAGVRGENTEGGVGILGITNSTFVPSAGGVFGILLDANGNSLASGGLGLRASNSLVYGVFANGNLGATGTKPFVEPHPTDASKVIRYVALEGPEAGTYFRGRGRFHDGQAVIDVPDSFRMVTDTEGLTVQITPIGAELTTANVVSASLDQIAVRSNHDVEFFYLVQGVRKAYKDWQPIAEGAEFVPNSPTDRIPAYLSEEAKRRLIQNGTYNADGSVNMATAAREGWTKAWAAHQAAQIRGDLAVEEPKP